MTTPVETHGSGGVTARCYTFPRRFLYPEIMLFSLIFALVAIAWIPVIYSLFEIGELLPSVLRAAAVPSITAAVILVLVLFVKFELRKVRFLLTDELLIRSSSLHARKMPLLGIESVALFRTPVSGGILSVNSGRQTIHIPLIVRHIRDLVSRIEGACAETAIAARINDATWRELHRRSALTDKAVKRAARAYQPLLTATAAMVPVAAVTGMFFWNISFLPLMIWSAIAPFFPVASFATADLILRLREKRENAKSADLDAPSVTIDETPTFVRTGIVFFLLYLCAGIIFRTFGR